MKDSDDLEYFLFFIFIFFLLIPFVIGYFFGKDSGYKECLDDIRLGKTPRYKLVKTAEKWVEVEK